MGASGRILLCLGLTLGVAEGAFELDNWANGLPLQAGGWAGNPAALSRAPCSGWRLVYYRPFALDQLHFASLMARRSGVGWGVAGALTSFGFDLYRETSGRLKAGLHWRQWGAGGEWGLGQLSGAGTKSRLGWWWGLGIEATGLGPWEVGLWQQSGPGPWRDRRVFLQVAYRHGDGSILRGHGRRAKGGRLDLSAGRPLGAARLEVGTRGGPRRFAVGLKARTKRWSGYYWVKIHPYLGLSQGLAVGNACCWSKGRPRNYIGVD
ncbi:MAG: hypothetical protein GKR89_20790 [Candidatus Latescibacteria bacterium]|nr:hypothetical protein [Candidatus Latescibacterota bacterium]